MIPPTLVAGVDSSTQSCKITVRNANTGEHVRHGTAPHPEGSEIDPQHWLAALRAAAEAAGGLDDVEAIAIAAQQHAMICLDEAGDPVRDALLWNDNRSAEAAADLVAELPGGAATWAQATGSVPVASLTVSKLRWLAEHEPRNAARTAAVCLPHDWLTWQLHGAPGIEALRTDRGDASGTGYWSAQSGGYRPDLLRLAMNAEPRLPPVLAPNEPAATTGAWLLGPGTGDNAAAALGLDTGPGDVLVSIGTSGVVSVTSPQPTSDPTGAVAGFADATGLFLPLVCTLNAARVLDAAAALLHVAPAELSDLALSAPPGADGVVLVPYLEGERTPNRPTATGAIHGLQLHTTTAAHVARAAVEGVLCSLADGLDALRHLGIEIHRALLIGGAARSPAIRQIAPTVLGLPVLVPATREYVADGAARQAAWALDPTPQPPDWPTGPAERYRADPQPDVRERYRHARDLTLERFEAS